MIKIKKSKNGQYYFTVHAYNGAVLVTSEMYISKRNCKQGITRLFMLNNLEVLDETTEK